MKKRYLQTLLLITVCLSMLLVFLSETQHVTRVQAQKDSISVDFRGYVSDASLQSTIIKTLENKPSDLFRGTQFAITSLRMEADWIILSVASLDGPDCSTEYVGASDCGNLILGTNHKGGWELALAGTTSFSSLLDLAPPDFIEPEAKPHLDPLARSLLTQNNIEYKFPWEGEWQYWQGWHGGTGGNALDIGTTGSDKRVLSPAGGTITEICIGIAAVIKIVHDDGKEMGYFHLDKTSVQNNNKISVGKRVYQGQLIGTLKSGYFEKDKNCYDQNANQTSTSAHLHWVFPKNNSSYMIDGWTIQYQANAGCGSASYWRQGEEVRKPQRYKKTTCQSSYHYIPSTNFEATFSYELDPGLTSPVPLQVYPRQQFEVEFKVRNTGTATWTPDLVKLGTYGGNRQDQQSYFYPEERAGGWFPGGSRIGFSEDVPPGSIATFKATFMAPLIDDLTQPQTVTEHFQIVAEGIDWLEGDGLTVSVNVACEEGEGFCDVPTDNEELSSAVTCVNDHKIMVGYSDGTFRLDRLIERGEAARMIARWWKEYDPKNTERNWEHVLSDPKSGDGMDQEFPDLSELPDKDELLWAAENLRNAGIVSGFSDGMFYPEEDINRAQALKMIVETLKKTNTMRNLSETEDTFGDIPDDYPESLKIAIIQGKALGIVEGYGDGTFRPDEDITRGQMALMVYRALLYGKNNKINLKKLKPKYTKCPKVPRSITNNSSTLTVRTASSMPLERHTHCFPASSDAVIPGISGLEDGAPVCYWFDDNTYRPLSDVSADYWARPFIEALYNAGITNGCNSSNRSYFCPDVAQSGNNGYATRLQIAKFVLRAKHYLDTGESGLNYEPPPAGSNIFVDVTSTEDAAWVNELYRRQITIGDTTCRPPGDNRLYYCPNAPVTRTQIAYFILRTLEGGSSYTNNLPHALGIFEDVPANDGHAAAIEEMYWRGFTHGDTTCNGSNDFNYCPSDFVDRAHAAVFLVRAFVQQPTPTERLGDLCFSTSSGYDIPRNGYITPGVYGVDDEDIVCYHKELNQFKMYFNGSVNGVEDMDLAALYIPSDGEIWFSTDSTETIPGIGTVGDEDVVVYENGSYSLEIDGSSSECLDGEDVDALHRWSSSRVYVSTTTGADCGSVDVDDDDIVRYRPSNGQFYDFFDGNGVGLSSNDIDGLTVWSNSSSDANLYFALFSDACLPSETGQICVDGGDIVQYRGTTGSSTSGLFSSYPCFDNDDHPGLENEYLDAIHVQNEFACVPPAALQASPPAADFEASPSSGDNPLFVTFTDTSTGGATSWLWDFGDGLFSTAQHPTHVYYNAGTYDVTLTVTGPSGTSSAEGQIIVNEAAPVADFWGSPSEGEAPLTVSFIDYSWGNITSWSWDFGDGSTSTEASPEHTYTQPGTYNVALTVNGPGGSNTLTVDSYITVLPGTSSPTPTNTPPSVTNTPTATSEVPTITPTNTQVVPSATPTATPPPSDQILLALSPATVNTGVGQTFDVVIEVLAGSQAVNGGSAYLNFDPSYLQVLSVTEGSSLPIDLQNEFDNVVGHVNFAAGSFTTPFPSGTFTLATVTMQAIAQADGSSITFNMSAPRQSDVTSGGSSVLDGTIPSTVIVSNTTIDASVTLQGRPSPPDSRWVVPLRVSLTVLGEGTPAYEFTPTTDENGHFTLTGIDAGTYEVRVKHAHTLQNVQTVTLAAGSNAIDLGTLREGDANDDNFITIIDFSILAATFGVCEGDDGYDARADFNGDGCITIIDFSLLASNFGQSGQSAPDLRGGEQALDAPAALAIEPAESTVRAGDTFTVMAAIQAGEQAVDGAQVVLNFDPDLLEVVTVNGGERLPQGLQNELDNESGTLRFAAGTLEAFPNGTIELLDVEFRALAPTDATSLTFAEGTDVTFGGVSVLGEQAGGTIVISQPTAIRVIELAAPTTAGWLWALLPLALTILAGAFISRRRR